jgi:NitT/TauT family transport system ATP-binding protein
MSDIVFQGVSRSFKRDGREQLAVDHVSLEVREREFVALVGPSGCGKTTCLRMAAGLDFPSAGSVTVGGKKVEEPGPQRAVVFQQFALFPWKTVYDNIDFGLRSQGVPEAERRARIAAQLELMGLQGFESAYPHQLSGGMQQRVAIARCYVLNPEVLLMDEPFGALDAQTRTLMQEELIKLARKIPRTVLFITHAVEEAVYLADRVVVMTRRPGKIAEIVEVAPVRAAGGWDRLTRVEQVMEQTSFTELKSRIWRLLREQQVNQERREHA